MKNGSLKLHHFWMDEITRSAYTRLQSNHFLYFLMLVSVLFYNIMFQKSNIYEWFSIDWILFHDINHEKEPNSKITVFELPRNSGRGRCFFI